MLSSIDNIPSVDDQTIYIARVLKRSASRKEVDVLDWNLGVDRVHSAC